MKTINHLSKNHSLIDNYIRQLRDINTQGSSELFRENIRRIGRVLAYEISKTLDYSYQMISTPLASHQQAQVSDELVVITILRAGLPLHDGILSAIPEAENGFISAYRKHDNNGGFEIEVGYVACPSLEGKVLILNDPMLATGSSFENAINALSKYGKPKRVHLAAVIASQEGVDYLDQLLDDSFSLWVDAIDPALNEEKFIVPGLGDAGDLSFGIKLQA